LICVSELHQSPIFLVQAIRYIGQEGLKILILNAARLCLVVELVSYIPPSIL
jgi:hypothetical protein